MELVKIIKIFSLSRKSRAQTFRKRDVIKYLLKTANTSLCKYLEHVSYFVIMIRDVSVHLICFSKYYFNFRMKYKSLTINFLIINRISLPLYHQTLFKMSINLTILLLSFRNREIGITEVFTINNQMN